MIDWAHFPVPRIHPLSNSTFEEIEMSLRRAGVMLGAAEAQGTISGLLCAGRITQREEWLDHVFAEADMQNANVGVCRKLLAELWDKTRDALRGIELTFEPMLPDDEDDLQARVDALAEWCQGFLMGTSLAQLSGFDDLPPDVAEILRDFADIGSGTLSLGDDSEQDEAAYMELAEYLKVGAQLVHDELNPVPPEQFRAPPGLH